MTAPEQLIGADLIVLPGTKSTMDDLRWLRTCGLEAQIVRLHQAGIPVLGICGGYQNDGTDTFRPRWCGEWRYDSAGIGILPTETVFRAVKTTTQQWDKF